MLRTPPPQTSGLLLTALLALCLSFPAHAAKKSADVYPAFEDEFDPAPESIEPKPKKAQKAKASKNTSAKTAKRQFDTVPPEQIDGIARRLGLVETLLRKYGRAYDYRVHTVRELETILSQLEGPTSGDAEPTLPAPPSPNSATL